MTSTQPTNTRRWRYVLPLIAFALALAGGITAALAGVRVTLNPQAAYEQAQAQWDTSAPDHYRVFVRVQAGFAADGVYELTVQDGELTDAKIYSAPAFRYDPDAPAFDVSLAEAGGYTPDALFNRARRLVHDFDALHFHLLKTSHVRYNTAYGYVESYVQNTCGWLFNDLVDTCITEIEVVRFEPLEGGTIAP
jgi:hypothetical protein